MDSLETNPATVKERHFKHLQQRACTAQHGGGLQQVNIPLEQELRSVIL
jgi:hypothetical protein